MANVRARLVLVLLGVVGCGAAPSGVSDVSDGTTVVASSLKAKPLHYEPVEITDGPPDFDGWAPFGITDKAQVVGQGFKCGETGCDFHVVVRGANGAFTVLAKNFLLNDVNGKGDVGGCTIDDPVSFSGQAGIVRANGKLDLIAKLPGEVASCVIKLSDNRVAAVISLDQASVATTYVLDRNRVTPFAIDLATVEDINDAGQVAGIIQTEDANRAYRFDAKSKTTTILPPVSPDPHSWGVGINRKGEVLGYSFVFDGNERIGKWNTRNRFETAFIEGTPEFPTVSNRLVWNEDGLIVVSYTPNDGNTYLIPTPGVRLNLADLVGGATLSSTLYALGINKGGDFAATSVDDGRSFLFLRTCD